jgi:hypothetical protein
MRGIAAYGLGRLRIDVSDVEVTATYLDQLGQQKEWDAASGIGPLFYEEQTYHLWVDGRDYAPTVRHRDPLFTRDITHRPEKRAASGTFNLQRQVGLLRFEIELGQTTIAIEFEVMPTKIDYRSDYEAVVAEVAAAARGLALAYMRSTFRGGSLTSERSTEIEWLTGLRQGIETLRQALYRVNSQPYRHLLREVRPVESQAVVYEQVS